MNAVQSKLLSLPPELHREIYTYVFEESDSIHLHVCRDDKTKHLNTYTYRIIRHSAIRQVGTVHNGRHRCSLALREQLQFPSATANRAAILLTCKQISFQATQVLYSSHNFKFTNTTHLANFLEFQPAQILENIRHITIGSQGLLRATTPRAFKLLQRASNLKSLSLHHDDFCEPPRLGVQNKKKSSCEWLSTAARPFLSALHESYEAQGLRQSILKVVKVTDGHTTESGIPWYLRCPCFTGVSTNWAMAIRDVDSEAIDQRVEARNREWTTRINELIASDLGIETPKVDAGE